MLQASNGLLLSHKLGDSSAPTMRARWPYTLLKWSLIILALKVATSIVVEYVSYFPANFNSAFLAGRRQYFFGIYHYAFYAHIIAGPITLGLMGLPVYSGKRLKFRQLHKRAGKLQIALLLLVLAPTGFVMSLYAFSGPIAGVGFAFQSVALATCAWLTVARVRQGRIDLHLQWSIRCNLLLCSPLLLRLHSGLMIVCDCESGWTYRASAWSTWIIPLAIYEMKVRWQKQQS